MEKADGEAIFATLDRAKAGKIGAAEIVAATSHLDPAAKDHVGELLAEFGKKPGDTLSLEEFIKGGKTKLGFVALFLGLDRDHDAKLSFDEFSMLPKGYCKRKSIPYDEAKAKDSFVKFDADKDGFLSIREMGELAKAHPMH